MMSDSQTRSIHFEKGRDRFVWRFLNGQEQEVLAGIDDLADDPNTSLDQQDALVLRLAVLSQTPEGAGRSWALEDHECNLGRERYDH